VVLATVHEDVVQWLQPDWAFQTETRHLVYSRVRDGIPAPEPPMLPTMPQTANVHKWFSVPQVKLDVLTLRNLPYVKVKELWKLDFAKHHYLRGDLQSCAVCLIVREAVTRAPVAFYASIPAPGTIRSAWREHRFVVRPEWQGLSIGPRISNLMAARFHANGLHYFSTTAHPRLAACRAVKGSPWKPTSGAGPEGKKQVCGTWGNFNNRSSKGHRLQRQHSVRYVFSHRYHGQCNNPCFASRDTPERCNDPLCLKEAHLVVQVKPDCALSAKDSEYFQNMARSSCRRPRRAGPDKARVTEKRKRNNDGADGHQRKRRGARSKAIRLRRVVPKTDTRQAQAGKLQRKEATGSQNAQPKPGLPQSPQRPLQQQPLQREWEDLLQREWS